MDPADLLDYALGKLDCAQREQIERRIAHDQELATRVARLIRNLDRLLDDGRCFRPSEGASSRRPGGDSSTRQDADHRPCSEEQGEPPPANPR